MSGELTFHDTLIRILNRIDTPSEPVFSNDEISWSDDDQAQLTELGILRMAEYAQSIVCDGCEKACIEEVIFINEPVDRNQKAYISCTKRDDIGRIPINTDHLKRWRIDLNGLAKQLSALIMGKEDCEVVINNRLWRIGSKRYKRSRADIFLARGTSWADADQIFSNAGRLKECSRPILLVPDQIPNDFPLTFGNRILSLVRLLNWHNDKLYIDTSEIENAFEDSYTRKKRVVQVIKPYKIKPGTTWREVTITFLNEFVVKIEIAEQLVDQREFNEIGFENRSKTPSQPDKKWDFLKKLARCGGTICKKDFKKGSKHDLRQTITEKQIIEANEASQWEYKKWADRVADINTRLNELFPGVEGRPIEYDYKQKGYVSNLNLIYAIPE